MIDSVKAFIGQDLIEVEDQQIRKKGSRVQIDLSSIARVIRLIKFLML